MFGPRRSDGFAFLLQGCHAATGPSVAGEEAKFLALSETCGFEGIHDGDQVKKIVLPFCEDLSWEALRDMLLLVSFPLMDPCKSRLVSLLACESFTFTTRNQPFSTSWAFLSAVRQRGEEQSWDETLPSVGKLCRRISIIDVSHTGKKT